MRATAEKIIEKHRANDGKAGNDANKERELQSIDTLMGNAKKIADFLAEHEPRMGQGERPKEVQSNIVDPESAKINTGNHGTFQGYVGIAAADALNQIIIHAEAYGMGQEQSTLVPTIESIEENLSLDLSTSGTVITADTGYSSEANMKYLFDKGVNAIVPDNLFRIRDPNFKI